MASDAGDRLFDLSYRVARPFLFALEPERAHGLALRCANLALRFGLLRSSKAATPEQDIELMGLRFPNRVGLAAGLDKNGEHIDALAALGFGHLEIGTVTPRPQPGNPRPRMFRLQAARAIINRMGFNNAGVENLVRNVRAASYRGILGINIGKNFDTPNERASDDYLACLRAVYPVASYVTINVSSPNTKDLRALQSSADMRRLLSMLSAEREKLTQTHGRLVPLAVKIAPDLSADEIGAIAELLIEFRIESLIATNTTVRRDQVAGLPDGNQAGGLSGAPLRDLSTTALEHARLKSDGRLALIGVGGICTASDAMIKREAGADLVQLYSGLIYRGPGLVTECVAALQSQRDARTQA